MEPLSPHIPEIPPKKVNNRIIIFIFSLVIILFFLWQFFIGSLFIFDTPKIVEIKQGQSLNSIVLNLKEAGVVTFPTLLSSSVILLNGESRIISGVYSFEKKLGTLTLAKRLLKGQTNIKAIKVTIPEGFTSQMIAERLARMISGFDTNAFLQKAKPLEGLLFPDTYFFLPTTSTEEIIHKMIDTFWQKTNNAFDFEMTENVTKTEIYKTLTLASIVEEEVRSFEDKKIVAGIFQNRLKIGMPLQADSTLAYVTGRDSLSLTVDDLKMENAYNSYKNKGLPPTPISNPGLESIEAVLYPTKTSYLYFLTDKEGKVYYAKTFEEHKKNKAKYLN